LQSQIFPDPGDGILQKLGDDCPCECDAPPHGLGWASHHPCTKWRGIFEANTSGIQALEVIILPWNWTVLVMKAQEVICFPFGPLRRGPDGLLLEEQGIMLNVAPVSTKNLSFVNRL
jgi:hypothetical protein